MSVRLTFGCAPGFTWSLAHNPLSKYGRGNVVRVVPPFSEPGQLLFHLYGMKAARI